MFALSRKTKPWFLKEKAPLSFFPLGWLNHQWLESLSHLNIIIKQLITSLTLRVFNNKSSVEAGAVVLALDMGKRHKEGPRQEKVLCTPRHGRKREQQQIIRHRLVFITLMGKVGHQTQELPFCSPLLVTRPYARSTGLAAKLALKPYTCICWCTCMPCWDGILFHIFPCKP